MKYNQLVIGKRYIAMNECLDTLEGVYTGIITGGQLVDGADTVRFDTQMGAVHLDCRLTDWHFTEVVPGEIEVL